MNQLNISRNFELSTLDAQLNAGITAEGNLLWSGKSRFPRALSTNLTRKTQEYSFTECVKWRSSQNKRVFCLSLFLFKFAFEGYFGYMARISAPLFLSISCVCSSNRLICSMNVIHHKMTHWITQDNQGVTDRCFRAMYVRHSRSLKVVFGMNSELKTS